MKHTDQSRADQFLDHRDALEVDRLIGRIVDGEATVADEREFARLASAAPALWERLFNTQRDASLLQRALKARLDELSIPDLPGATVSTRRNWTWAVSGWAAVLILAVSWVVIASQSKTEPNAIGREESVRPVTRDVAATATPDEHLDAYLQAPFVLGELDPIMLEAHEQPDGSIMLRYIRRIEERMLVEPNDPLPIDKDGRLQREPKLLRDGGVPASPDS